MTKRTTCRGGVWFRDEPEAGARTGLLTLTLDGDGDVKASCAPARVGRSGLPEFATGRRAERMASRFDALKRCAGLG